MVPNILGRLVLHREHKSSTFVRNMNSIYMEADEVERLEISLWKRMEEGDTWKTMSVQGVSCISHCSSSVTNCHLEKREPSISSTPEWTFKSRILTIEPSKVGIGSIR